MSPRGRHLGWRVRNVEGIVAQVATPPSMQCYALSVA